MDATKTILVPVAFDETSEAAITTAVRFAKGLGATLLLLHVQPFRLTNVADGGFYEGPSPSHRAEGEARAELSQMVSAHEKDGVAMETMQREGIIWDEILGVARDRKVELIVMGTHGRKGLARGLLGSVAEHVVRHAPVPVMTVRANGT